MVGISSCNTAVVYVHRSLLVAESIVSQMILPVVLLSLSTIFAQDLHEGDSCSFSNGDPGVCILLNKCPSVYQHLLAGNRLDKLCKFADIDPIVCCPKDPPTTITTAPVPQENRDGPGDGRGAIARAKCAEYAKFVYVLRYPPTLGANRKPVNVSECALKANKLIVGGIKAEPMEFPHMAAVGFNSENDEISWGCGGSLISENFVLTAAHCTDSISLGNATWVRLGDLNLVGTDDGATPVDRRVTERIKHPQYKSSSKYHNIGLLRFESSVLFNAWIRPACLHTQPSTGTQNAIATGWGYVEWGADAGSSDLLKVTLPLVDLETCKELYPDIRSRGLQNGIDGEGMVCAGKIERDTCQGDSGGPLVVYSQTQYCMYDVVGITSFGRLCGTDIPSIYTRVYYYVPWIESVVWPSK